MRTVAKSKIMLNSWRRSSTSSGVSFEADAEGFADGHDVIFRHDVAVHLLKIFVAMRAVGVDGGDVLHLIGRDVGEGLVFGDERDDVHAEAVDAFVEPELHEVVDFVADLGVVPVEVGLLHGEVVQVVFVGRGIFLPGGAEEEGWVVVGRELGSVGTGLAGTPDVVVAIGIVFGFAALDEPAVFVAGVVDDEVDDEAHVALLDAFEQGVEVVHGAELFHDLAVVADVVAVVGVGRVVVGAEPDDVDAEVLQVVELGGDAGEVADSVAVGVFEGAGVDLVDDGFFPPFLGVAVGGGGVGWRSTIER